MQRRQLRSPSRPKNPRLLKTRFLRAEMLEPRALMSGTDLGWSLGELYAMAPVKATLQTVAVADTADTTLASVTPYSNYGRIANLTVACDTVRGTECQAILRFNASGVTGTLTAAVLQFNVLQWSNTDPNAVLRIRLLSDANDNWVEGGGGINTATTGATTWNNRPLAEETAVTISAAQWPRNGRFAVDVTSLVNQAANSNGVATFVVDVVSSGRTTVVLASREYKSAGLRPSLTLTRVVPPPNWAPTLAVVAKAATSTVTGTGTTLSALGADDGGESNLTYTWSATTVPAGGTATFSVNGTNAAKTTSVLFSKAGVYTLSVKITDAKGLSVVSAVRVTVTSTLSGISVSPGSVTVAPGATQAFAAAGVDQFGNVLTSLTNLVWSTTAGTISTTGILKAPTTGSVTVTAASGAYRGSATVTVAASSFLGLGDAGLSGLTQSLFVDGSISRLDMIQILRSTGSDDGVVDAVEFADLKTIISNAAVLKMASYVEVLARDVVLGSVANAYYQGQVLGNLTAGSAASVMTRLVDKWFLGADHPGTSIGSYTRVAGTLFVNGATHFDMYQGQLGDCYLIASLGSIADTAPAAIQNMIVDNGDNTWTVRFYVNGVADYVTVDRYLPASSGRLVYAGYGASVTSTSTELWIPLIEKAYAQWNETGKEGRDGRNLYSSIEGGWMANVYTQVLGKAASSYSLATSSSSTVLANAMLSKMAVTIGTKASGTLGFGLYNCHAYDVVGYNSATGTYTLYNPWGSNQPTTALTWAQLQSVCDWFAVANPAGTTPISQVRSQPSGTVWAMDQAYAALGQAATPTNFVPTHSTTERDEAVLELMYQQV